MIYSQKEKVSEFRENMRGGKGIVEIIKLSNIETPNLRLSALIILPQGASIGSHQHLQEAEQYYILEGSGIYSDNGKLVHVSCGDTMICKSGEFHSIENTEKESLKFLAYIITE